MCRLLKRDKLPKPIDPTRHKRNLVLGSKNIISKQYQKWLQRHKWWLIIGLSALMAIYILFAIGDWAPWMGFKGKTLWEWLQLLGVPFTLAVLGYFFQRQEQKHSRNEAKDEILDTYFDFLSAFLVDKKLLAIAAKLYSKDQDQVPSQNDSSVSPEQKELFEAAINVIRARTLSILRRFQGDSERKTSVIQFLVEAEMISKAKLDLSYSDLRGANLSFAPLGGSYLSFAKLGEVNLSFANLEGANLGEAILAGANLEGTNLVGAYLEEANLKTTMLKHANLSNANLSNANLSNADLSKANLEGANLSGANLEGAQFNYFANLKKANLEGANLNKANLIYTFVDGANFTFAKLNKAKLNHVDLTGANLHLADIRESDLSFANLEGVDLKGRILEDINFAGANLKGANFESSSFKGSDFTFTNFEDANLAGTNLENVNLKEIQWSSKTIWPDKKEVAKARNIPEKLKQELGITLHAKSENSENTSEPEP